MQHLQIKTINQKKRTLRSILWNNLKNRYMRWRECGHCQIRVTCSHANRTRLFMSTLLVTTMSLFVYGRAEQVRVSWLPPVLLPPHTHTHCHPSSLDTVYLRHKTDAIIPTGTISLGVCGSYTQKGLFHFRTVEVPWHLYGQIQCLCLPQQLMKVADEKLPMPVRGVSLGVSPGSPV